MYSEQQVEEWNKDLAAMNAKHIDDTTTRIQWIMEWCLFWHFVGQSYGK